MKPTTSSAHAAVTPLSQTTESGDLAGPERVLRAIARHWRLMAGIIAASIFATAALWFLVPRDFVATAVLIPSAGQAAGGGTSVLSSLPAGLQGLAGGADPQQRLVGTILRSRSVREAVVAQESLPAQKAVISALMGKKTNLTKRADDGAIIVSVSASDAQLAAQTANRFGAAINLLAARINREAATRRNAFLDQQLAAARDRLVQTEQQVLSFQQQGNAAEPQEQASRTIDAAAQLQQAINLAELEVGRLRRTVTDDNPMLRSALADLNLRREQLRQLTAGNAGNPVFVSLRRGPQLKVQAARLAREQKKDEQVYISLTAALAQSQIDQNNNLPVLTVLDPALVPVEPDGSLLKRLLLATILGTLAGLGILFVREYGASSKALSVIRSELRSSRETATSLPSS